MSKLDNFFAKVMEKMDEPDDLHEIVNGHVVAKDLNAQALGKLGGIATKKKYGKAHYQKLAANMNKKLGRGTK